MTQLSTHGYKCNKRFYVFPDSKSQFQCTPLRTKLLYQLVHTKIAVSVHTFSYHTVVPTSALKRDIV